MGQNAGYAVLISVKHMERNLEIDLSRSIMCIRCETTKSIRNALQLQNRLSSGVCELSSDDSPEKEISTFHRQIAFDGLCKIYL